MSLKVFNSSSEIAGSQALLQRILNNKNYLRDEILQKRKKVLLGTYIHTLPFLTGLTRQ